MELTLAFAAIANEPYAGESRCVEYVLPKSVLHMPIYDDVSHCGTKDGISKKEMQSKANCTVAICKCGSDFPVGSVIFNMKWWGGAKYS